MVLQMLENFFFVVSAQKFDFEYFGIDKRSVPPALEKRPDKPRCPIQKRTFPDITVTKISKRAPKQRQPSILVFFHAFAKSLKADFSEGHPQRPFDRH